MDYVTFTLIIVVFYSIYKFLTKNLSYFEKLGVPYSKGWPVIGNMEDIVFRKRHMTGMYQEIYNLYPKAKYVGFFDFTNPMFMLRDLELIKDVTIKNFDNFPDHKPMGDESLDPFFGGNLFNLMGERWKKMRNTLSPSFTSSKMKMMFHLMVECAENVVSFIDEQSVEERKMTNCKDLFTKYANDVIATCGFGIKVDSLRDPNNDFYVLGRKATNMEGFLAVKLFLSRSLPGVMKFFNMKLFSDEIANFFTQLVRDTVKMRDEKGINRPDMIQLMMDARKTSDLTINEMTAQAFIFFFAGFDTTSSTTCMIAHELAINQDVQNKLQDEIDEVMSEHNGKPTYEAINNMTYLDAIFNEINRLHGQGFILDRVCKIPYELPPSIPGAKPIKLEPGDRILIPAWAIHRDPNYYEDPNKFIPERYLDKKVTINDVYNLSFGIGPRSCIGNRFAILEIKTLFVYLLAKYSLIPNEKTCASTKYSRKSATIQTEGGVCINMKLRR